MSIQLHLAPILLNTPACCTRCLCFLQPFQPADFEGTKQEMLHLAENAKPALGFESRFVTFC